MLPTYMQRMRNNNLDIRIVCSSCRPQLYISMLKSINYQYLAIKYCTKYFTSLIGHAL